MLKNQEQKGENSIQQSLQKIHGVIARAICPPLPKDTASIEQARLDYEKLLEHEDAQLYYDFPPFGFFCNKVENMRADVFYKFITNTKEIFAAMKVSSHSTVVPANAYVDTYGKAGENFEESIFEQMDVVDVLSGNYHIEPAQSHMVHVVSISATVQAVEAAIVALYEVSGLRLGTGMLIRPRLVLTARHCIEDTMITQLNVRLNFQKSADGSITSITSAVQGIVEEDLELDYAILLLKEKVDNFVPVKIDMNGSQPGSSIFIHHPLGWIKKVSVHSALEAPASATSIAHSSFHDSMKGSSGGVYIDANQRICAIHLLNTEGVTYARYISELREKSDILKRSFDDDGNWKKILKDPENKVLYHDQETYWNADRKRQDVYYSFYQEGAKALPNKTISPTKKELEDIKENIEEMDKLRSMNKKSDTGYRIEFPELSGRPGWKKCEVQRNGNPKPGVKTTVAQVSYEEIFSDDQINILKIGLKISLNRGYSITIEQGDLDQLVQNKDNDEELKKYFNEMIDKETKKEISLAAQSNPPEKVKKSKKKR